MKDEKHILTVLKQGVLTELVTYFSDGAPSSGGQVTTLTIAADKVKQVKFPCQKIKRMKNNVKF